MADKFDPYREALVVETETIWPEEYEVWDEGRRHALAQRLHDSPEEAAQISYFRVHTGFCRQITVTEEDLARLGEGVEA